MHHDPSSHRTGSHTAAAPHPSNATLVDSALISADEASLPATTSTEPRPDRRAGPRAPSTDDGPESIPEFAGEPWWADDAHVLRQAVEAAPASIFWKDINSRFVGGNEESMKQLGVSSLEEMLGRTDYDFFPHDMAKEFRATDRRVMDTGEAIIEFDELIVSPDGVADVLHTSKAPLRNTEGEVIGLVGGSRKVTTAVQVEAALWRSQERYTLVTEASRDGIWDWDRATNDVELSPRCAELLGLPGVGMKIPAAEAVNRFSDDQTEVLIRHAKAVLELNAGTIETTLSIDCADGSRRWLQIVGTPFVRNDVIERIVGLLADITDEVERERELEHRATHDSLTGLRNSWSLNQRTDQVLASGRPASMLYLDLDQFKIINDSLGHHVGDQMLQAVAERLNDLVGDVATLARIGGDEFAVLYDGLASAEVEQIADLIVRDFARPFEIAGLEMYSSVSIGIVHIGTQHKTALDVMRDADTCLYSAKAAGKSCYRVFESTMRDDADRALLQQNRIRRAVDSMQFVLHYQPIWDARRKTMVGAEALIRWNSEEGEPLEQPHTFLPFLEQTGLIVPVGEWVIATACHQLATWRAADSRSDQLYVTVNLSQIQFRSPKLVETVLAAVDNAGISPSDLVIEVTETATVSVQLQRLRDHGIRIAIDDFGVGQSSLSTLNRLPVDILKLDRSLVSELTGSEAAPVTSGVIAMAHALGLVTVAEGIELAEQREWLERASCDLMQGYLFARPMPPGDILNHLG